MESAYFEQTDVFLDLLEAKEELIDRYLRGELPAEERRLFRERFFPVACLRNEVEVRWLAQTFSGSNEDPPGKVAETPAHESGTWARPAWLAATTGRRTLGWAAALLLSLLGIVLALRGFSPREEVADSRTPAQSATLPTPIEPIIRDIELAPGGARRAIGGDNYKLELDSSVSQARIKLRLAGKIYPVYRATLFRKDGGIRVVATRDALTPAPGGNPSFLIWTSEAAQLPAGDYLFKLEGSSKNGKTAPAGAYELKIRRQ
ncbi:MAG: hypothetical protein ACKVX9_13690 [Blastocatellia bacterium]